MWREEDRLREREREKRSAIFDSISLLKESTMQFVYQRENAVLGQANHSLLWAAVLTTVKSICFLCGSSPQIFLVTLLSPLSSPLSLMCRSAGCELLQDQA